MQVARLGSRQNIAVWSEAWRYSLFHLILIAFLLGTDEWSAQILFHFSLDLEESIDQEAVIEVTLQ